MAALATVFLCAHAAAEACHSTVLPVTFRRMLPTVPVTLNGQTIRFVIDSGAQLTTIAPEAATQLQLPTDSHYYYSRVRGVTGEYRTVNAVVRSFEFAGASYKRKRVNVIPVAAPPAKDPAFVPVNGLIGADILTDFAFEYDAMGRTFTFFPTDSCSGGKPDWKGKYARVPISVTESNAVAVPVLVNGQKLTGILDTGAEVTVMTLAAAKRLGLTKEMLSGDRHFKQSGVGGDSSQSSLHQFGSMVIAGETLHNPRIVIAKFTAGEADMLIGEDYMLGHKLRVSYASQVLYVQKEVTAKPAK